MEDVLYIQRDDSALIQHAIRCLKKCGLLIFSNSLRKFKLDEELLALFDIEDRTKQSIPFDYARRTNIHHCFHIKHKAD